MKLEQIQQDFIDSIFNVDRETAEQHVAGDKVLNAEQRLGIYRGSVHGILTQSLGDTYPVCKALLGDTFFDKMCDRFIDQYPPSSPFFSHYGDQLSTFLESFEPARSVPFIADTAHFEWTRHRLWQETLAEPFDFSIIAQLTEEQQTNMVFVVNRALRLFESNYRIDLIWFAHQDDNEITLEALEINQPCQLLMWKNTQGISVLDRSDIRFDTATNQESPILTNKLYWAFLQALSQDGSINHLASTFGESFPALLNKSIVDGWIESIRY